MEVKEMRTALKEVVETVPRSNLAVIELYNKKFGENETPCDVIGAPDTTVKLKPEPNQVARVGNEYTYIGFGDEPPPVIKFMGLQVFTRGIPTMVTNAEVLAKIGTNRSFVKGKVDGERIVEQDELAKKRCEKIREEDTKIQIMSERKNRG